MSIVWHELAVADLNAILDYLLERNVEAAQRTFQRVRERVELLVEHPNLGRPGRVEGTRELIIGQTPYIVAYTIDYGIGAVVVLRVLHGAQRWPENFAGLTY
ncbi:MAG: type II toxin-antitoxin system RelE/ParE family toxin [Chloroflexota bacterium]